MVVGSVLYLHVAVFAQGSHQNSGRQSYNVPIASTNNMIELTVVNGSSMILTNVAVVPQGLPSWIHMMPTEQTLLKLSQGKDVPVRFTFSVDKSAPMGQEQIIRFTMKSTIGEVGTKEIKISVTHPDRFQLLQNYPNPFNPETKIEYTLPASSHVKLVIYDVLGQEVQTLTDEIQEAGYKSVTFDATRFAGGVYFYRLQAGNFVEVKKMLLTK